MIMEKVYDIKNNITMLIRGQSCNGGTYIGEYMDSLRQKELSSEETEEIIYFFVERGLPCLRNPNQFNDDQSERFLRWVELQAEKEESFLMRVCQEETLRTLVNTRPMYAGKSKFKKQVEQLMDKLSQYTNLTIEEVVKGEWLLFELLPNMREVVLSFLDNVEPYRDTKMLSDLLRMISIWKDQEIQAKLENFKELVDQKVIPGTAAYKQLKTRGYSDGMIRYMNAALFKWTEENEISYITVKMKFWESMLKKTEPFNEAEKELMLDGTGLLKFPRKINGARDIFQWIEIHKPVGEIPDDNWIFLYENFLQGNWIRPQTALYFDIFDPQNRKKWDALKRPAKILMIDAANSEDEISAQDIDCYKNFYERQSYPENTVVRYRYLHELILETFRSEIEQDGEIQTLCAELVSCKQVVKMLLQMKIISPAGAELEPFWLLNSGEWDAWEITFLLEQVKTGWMPPEKLWSVIKYKTVFDMPGNLPELEKLSQKEREEFFDLYVEECFKLDPTAVPLIIESLFDHNFMLRDFMEPEEAAKAAELLVKQEKMPGYIRNLQEEYIPQEALKQLVDEDQKEQEKTRELDSLQRFREFFQEKMMSILERTDDIEEVIFSLSSLETDLNDRTEKDVLQCLVHDSSKNMIYFMFRDCLERMERISRYNRAALKRLPEEVEKLVEGIK